MIDEDEDYEPMPEKKEEWGTGEKVVVGVVGAGLLWYLIGGGTGSTWARGKKGGIPEPKQKSVCNIFISSRGMEWGEYHGTKGGSLGYDDILSRKDSCRFAIDRSGGANYRFMGTLLYMMDQDGIEWMITSNETLLHRFKPPGGKDPKNLGKIWVQGPDYRGNEILTAFRRDKPSRTEVLKSLVKTLKK